MTLIKQIHNKLRQEYNWYRIWHNFKYTTIFHFIMLIVTTFAISAITLSQMQLDFMDQNKISFSMSDSATVTEQVEFQAGTYSVGLDLITSQGNATLFPESSINLLAIYNNDNNSVTVSEDEANKGKVVDGNTDTFWANDSPPEGDGYWQIDLGQQYDNISKNRAYVHCLGAAGSKIYYSLNGTDWVDSGNSFICGGPPDWDEFITNFSARYIRVYTGYLNPAEFFILSELEFYFQPLIATHTSSPTQIGDVSSDPGRYVVEYNGFDTTETEPANTAIDYRFQLVNSSGVSTDGWTAWALGDVADLATTYPSQLTLSQTKIDAGETYLQVQSRLTTTDGVSTPTLSDYTASYHTNKAPNTPTPQ